MRIHFWIYEWSDIRWPNRCLWCGANAEKWLKVRKKNVYDFQYRIFWVNILSREQTLYYPVCKKHHFIGRFLQYPSIWGFLLLLVIMYVYESDLIANSKIMYPYVTLTLLTLFIGILIYVRKNALIIQRVNKDYTEISLPDGKYAEDFGQLNNCTAIDRHLLVQEIDLE